MSVVPGCALLQTKNCFYTFIRRCVSGYISSTPPPFLLLLLLLLLNHYYTTTTTTTATTTTTTYYYNTTKPPLLLLLHCYYFNFNNFSFFPFFLLLPYLRYSFQFNDFFKRSRISFTKRSTISGSKNFNKRCVIDSVVASIWVVSPRHGLDNDNLALKVE